MDMFQIEIRRIVLTMKKREARSKKEKEDLTEKLRTLQNDPSSTWTSLAQYTQRFLYKIKTSEEENKWFRKNLHEFLTKIKNLHTKEKENISTEQTSVPDIQIQHTVQAQNHQITPECKPEIKTQQTHILILNTPATDTNPNGLEKTVKFKIYLTFLNFFTGKHMKIQNYADLEASLCMRTENKMGIG